MHNIARLPITGADQKKRRKQEHGKENAEAAQEARSHQAVEPHRLKLKSPGGNKNMAKKTLKKAKKLENTKTLIVLR
jgi:hypothetical protein